MENGGLGEGEKIKEGTVGSQVSPRLIRSEKFGEGWRREERFEEGVGRVKLLFFNGPGTRPFI